ncbi:MAG TPA: hypothetical protein VFG83_00110 [Kofleriaceae bacterium]|nr:hypothetical protein [Kofleriaceae bacterium]
MLFPRVRAKNIHRWAGGYARHELSRSLVGVRARRARPRYVLFALCDHFEPFWHRASPARAFSRTATWRDQYPKLGREFRDSFGRPPRHTMFYPGEDYAPRILDILGELARDGLAEVELHLHHDGDTADTLRDKINGYLGEMAEHGHISRDGTGGYRYAFIHGNWCLANSRRDRRYCGVDDELAVLFETGCYADFTFPSAPHETQPPTVNQIYWPAGDLARRAAHARGHRARVGHRPHDRMLMIQGPLAVCRRASGKWRIDSGAIDANDPPTAQRVRTWVNRRIHVAGRPEWIFVKVHTHGAVERNAGSLLGDGGRALHRALAGYKGGDFRLLYVSAREMFNVAVAAMDGKSGSPLDYVDYAVAPAPVTCAKTLQWTG